MSYKTVKTTTEQRNKLLDLIINKKYNEANSVAYFLGFTDYITAEFFEYIVAKEGLHMKVITALALYYDLEVKDYVKSAGEAK